MNNLVFCLMGPTASGKTALACDLVQQFPFEIISVDSAMIYREMDIGTAKPSAEELLIAPHHLIDIKNPTDSYSAADFCKDTNELCKAIVNRGKIPLLVGGTMMYFNALQKGLATLPEADATVRRQLEEEGLLQGWDKLHKKLAAVDPITAARIHENDAQRIQRALEVYYLTGTPLSALMSEQNHSSPYQFINLLLFPQNRAWLHERIAMRFDVMLNSGFIDEVQRLQAHWNIQMHMPAMRCVGYRQVLEYLNGDFDLSSMREKGIAATRQLAKRQLTWLRHWEQAQYYDPQLATFDRQIIAKIREILDNERL